MIALLKHSAGSGNVALSELPIPEPGSGEVCIRVMACGICGTDIHILMDDSYPVRPPVILGHELAGVIAKVGEGVTEWAQGARVVSETYYKTCGTCAYCKTGRRNLCGERLSIGSGVNGAMAEYVVVPAANLHAIPAGVGFAEASLTEPLACCVQAVFEKADLSPGDAVILTGPGPIGLLCLQAALQFDCRCIVVGTPKDEERLKLAKSLGAELALRTNDADLLEKIAALEGGPLTAFECSGAGAAVELCLTALRKGGRYVQVGLSAAPVPVDTTRLALRELTMGGTFAQKTEWWDKSVRLIKHRKVNLSPIVSHTYPLVDWEKAFANVIAGEGLKHVLLP